jgi:phosphoribosylaminoimidazole-succinocarboxamide synthase
MPTTDYNDRIRSALNNCLTEISLPGGKQFSGKVRERFEYDDLLILITTDRQSAFDRVLTSVPFKGQVLNLTSAWWFEQTADKVPNHLLSVPDPNVTVARKCTIFPVEFVVRGYITGSTSTSLWTVYNQGHREYCGNTLPEGLVKNQQLEKPILTPTTKEVHHDRPVSPEEIVSTGLMRQEEWDLCSQMAMTLFEFGQEKARENGLILVDTKYEMGYDSRGETMVVDELHTPDSSRYWMAASYHDRFEQGQEPESIDKEFLRLWYIDHCDPYNDPELPPAPEDLVVELSRRYIQLYESITGKPFPFPDTTIPVGERIRKNVDSYFQTRQTH